MNPAERFVVYPALIVLGALSTTKQGSRPAFNEATFRKITIVGNLGEPLVILGDDQAGGGIMLYDVEGKPRVRLTGVVPVGVSVLGPDHKPRAGLGVTTPTLEADETRPGSIEKARETRAESQGEEGFVFTAGANNRTRVYVGTAPESGGSLRINGPDGKLAAGVTSTDGFGSVELRGPDGKPRVEMGRLEKSEGGTIRAMGTTGKPYAVMCALENGGVFMSWKPDGEEVVWSSTPP